MIKIIVDWTYIHRIIDKILFIIIAKRAYKGYIWYVKNNFSKPWTYKEFKNNPTIHKYFSFQIYLERIKNIKAINKFYRRNDVIKNIFK